MLSSAALAACLGPVIGPVLCQSGKGGVQVEGGSGGVLRLLAGEPGGH